MEELTRFKVLRKAYKSHVTRVFNKIDKIFNMESLDELSVAYLPTAIDQLTMKLETFKELNNRIANLIQDPEQLEHAILEAEDVQKEITAKIGKSTLSPSCGKVQRQPRPSLSFVTLE